MIFEKTHRGSLEDFNFRPKRRRLKVEIQEVASKLTFKLADMVQRENIEKKLAGFHGFEDRNPIRYLSKK